MADKKFGIEEITDVLDFVEGIVDDLHTYNKDGKISTAEIAMASIKSAPAGIKAVAGASEITKEISDLDDEEKEELARRSVVLAQKLVAFFVPEVMKA